METGAITDVRVIAVAPRLERLSYRLADAVTVLSDDLRENVAAKVAARRAATVQAIPNFVDTDAIAPRDRMTAYRRGARHRRRAGRAVRRQHRLLPVSIHLRR